MRQDQGQGQDQWPSGPNPRPYLFEAKATIFCPRGREQFTRTSSPKWVEVTGMRIFSLKV